jgi:hypothetical protein
MGQTLPLMIGQWYQDQNTNMVFEVVAIDPLQHYCAIQLLDGNLAELASEDWCAMQLIAIAAPHEAPDPLFQEYSRQPRVEDSYYPNSWYGFLASLDDEQYLD